jgi:hypothetical protein
MHWFELHPLQLLIQNLTLRGRDLEGFVSAVQFVNLMTPWPLVPGPPARTASNAGLSVCWCLSPTETNHDTYTVTETYMVVLILNSATS